MLGVMGFLIIILLQIYTAAATTSTTKITTTTTITTTNLVPDEAVSVEKVPGTVVDVFEPVWTQVHAAIPPSHHHQHVSCVHYLQSSVFARWRQLNATSYNNQHITVMRPLSYKKINTPYHFRQHRIGFPKVKWLHLTGEVDKSVRFSCQIFSGFNMPKIIKIS